MEPASPKVVRFSPSPFRLLTLAQSSPALTSTPETTLPGTVLIEGALHRKNVMDSATQRASNRQWKQVDCRIVDHEMCFFRAGSEFKVRFTHNTVFFASIFLHFLVSVSAKRAS